jgi:glycerophosphoryl diester phosphodiesterase
MLFFSFILQSIVHYILMEIIGHRGARGEAPENTVEAILAGKKAGVDMIEIDVRLQKDTVVLSHDVLLESRSYTTLSEALEACGTTALNIEIKETRVVPLLSRYVEKYQGTILLSSFDMPTLYACKKTFPDTPLAVLESWSGMRATYRAKKLGTKRIHMNQRWLWRGFIWSMTKRGWHLYAYTVNSTRQATSYMRAGIKGVFTDYPTRFVSYCIHKK